MNDLYFRDKPEEKEKAARLQPVGRLGTPQDIANAALFLQLRRRRSSPGFH
jgi:NAD(P)-dependent dehydrogenase (short-subunit alcohol dehydrogenase family)